jgi:hypothetical protein
VATTRRISAPDLLADRDDDPADPDQWRLRSLP